MVNTPATLKYHNLLQDILTNGYEYPDPRRSGVFRKELFGVKLEFDFNESVPFIISKPLYHRGIYEEFKWIFSGDTNIAALVCNNVDIWNKDAFNYAVNNGFIPKDYDMDSFVHQVRSRQCKYYSDLPKVYRFGDIGPSYGHQLRHWDGEIDQLLNLIEKLLNANNSGASDLLCSVWNVKEVEQVALKPCHHEMQFNSRIVDGVKYLDLQFSMRSSDAFLGLPWNIAYYAYVLMFVSSITNYKPGKLIYFGKKVHLYNNQYEKAKEQINMNLDMFNEPKFIKISDTFAESIKFAFQEELTSDTITHLILCSDYTDFQLTPYNSSKKRFNVEMLAQDIKQ